RDAVGVGQAGRFHKRGVLLVGARTVRCHRRDDYEVVGVVVLEVARTGAVVGGLQRDPRTRVQRDALVGVTWRGVVGDREMAAVAVGVVAIRQAEVAPVDAIGRDWPRREAASLPRSGRALVTLGGRWVDDASVVEAVSYQAPRVAQHHAAGARGE